MACLIDASILITLERRGQPLSALTLLLGDEPFAVPSIVASELLAGVYRAEPFSRRQRRAAVVEAMLSELSVLPFDLQVARAYARIWVDLAAVGRSIGPHDLLIAATALTHEYSVLTENARHFIRIPGLTVRQPNW